MILTINLNPTLEKTYYMGKLFPRVETEAEKTIYKCSGAGIKTSQIMNNLNLDVSAIGFIGGLVGSYIINELNDHGIRNDFMKIKDETKSSITLIENNKFLAKVNEIGPRITRDELVGFYDLYERNMTNCEIICGLDSLPIGVPEDIYFILIKLANKMGKRFILEAKGKELKYGLEAKPYMVKLTIEELENLTHLKLDFENEIIKAANYVLEKDVDIIVIDLDDKGSIVLNQERGYRIEINNKEYSSLGMDQGFMMAGYIFGMDKDYDLEVTMKLGQAFRIAYSLVANIEDVDMSDIKKIMNDITILPIYY